MGSERAVKGKSALAGRAMRVAKEIRRPAVSRQYIVGGADDPAEARADAAADAAMRSLSASDWRSSATSSRIRRATAAPGDVSTIGIDGGVLDDASAAMLRGAIGRGRPMSGDLGDRVRRSLGHDVSDVRVHADRTADTIASRIQASAFTVGRDMFFARGQYRPDSAEGMHTILHEASHVAANGSRIARSTVRRKIDTTPKQLESTVGVGGRIKAAFKSSQNAQLFDDVVKFLRSYEKSDVESRDPWLRYLMLACERFLNLSAGTKDPTTLKQRSMVEDLHAQAFTEQGKLKAQQEYTRAAYSKPDAAKPETSGLWNQTDSAKGKYKVHEGAKALATGKTTPNENDKVGGFDHAALQEMRKYKLTEAEVLAIRTYTAGDFAYINPAMVSYRQESAAAPGAAKTEAQTRDETNAGWWAGKQGAKSGDEKAQLRAEGGLHAGVALSGLNKLPRAKATTWRGMSYPAALVPIDLVVGKTLTWNSFTSTSTILKKATGFSGYDPTATVFEINVINGRDLRRLSVFHSSEGEILMLPGAKVIVRSVGTVPGKPNLRLVKVDQIA